MSKKLDLLNYLETEVNDEYFLQTNETLLEVYDDTVILIEGMKNQRIWVGDKSKIIAGITEDFNDELIGRISGEGPKIEIIDWVKTLLPE